MLRMHVFQLDLCKKMAEHLARTTAGCIMRIPISLCMDSCYFSGCRSYRLGMLVDCDIGPRYNWSGSHNGWDCSVIGFLFNYALVENAMAKLKYVLPSIFLAC